jgi:hypothetical protein
MVHRWMEDTLGRRQIRRTCFACGEKNGFAPQVEPFTTEASAAASPTATLDMLLWAEEVGIGLKSDGTVADFANGEDYKRAEPAMRDLLAECRSRLGKLMGRKAP